VKNITELMLELENEYNLLEWKIDGVFAWQSARAMIYAKLIRLYTSKNHDHTRKKYNVKDSLLLLMRIIFNATFRNPYFYIKRKEVLVFESGRYEYFGKKNIDIFTEYICDTLISEKVKFEKYSYDYTTNINMNNQHYPHIEFILMLSRIFQLFVRHKFTDEELLIINNINTVISRRLGIIVEIGEILHNELKRFKTEYVLYYLLIRLKKSKKIYLISSVHKAPLIFAAKQCNNVVIELQHGIITKEGIIGHYPNTPKNSLVYFPDYFAVWKKPHVMEATLPISTEYILEIENEHLLRRLGEKPHYMKNPKQVLIISGPYIAIDLFNYIISNIIYMRDWVFVYKLHPEENIEYYHSILSKTDISVRNLRIVNAEQSIYSLLRQSQYVIGVNSTALFEAKYFGCDVFYLDNNEAEYDRSIYVSNGIKPINVKERISKSIF
jgi:hypothetical protein